MADHHDAIPSITSRPSANVSLTPLAEATGYGASPPVAGAYGCHTKRESQSTISSGVTDASSQDRLKTTLSHADRIEVEGLAIETTGLGRRFDQLVALEDLNL